MKILPSKDAIIPGLIIAMLAMVIVNKIPALKARIG